MPSSHEHLPSTGILPVSHKEHFEESEVSHAMQPLIALQPTPSIVELVSSMHIMLPSSQIYPLLHSSHDSPSKQILQLLMHSLQLASSK